MNKSPHRNWLKGAFGLSLGLIVLSGCGGTDEVSRSDRASDRVSGEDWVRQGVFSESRGSEPLELVSAEHRSGDRRLGGYTGGGAQAEEDDLGGLGGADEEFDEEDFDEEEFDDEEFDEEDFDEEELDDEEDVGEEEMEFDDLDELDDQGAQDVLNDLSEQANDAPVARRTRRSDDRSGRSGNADELLRQARLHMENAELIKAERAVNLALRSDPSNSEAQRLHSELRLLLGAGHGGVEAIVDTIFEEQNVAREQAMVEVSRLMSRASSEEEEGQFSQSLKSYERALDIIRSFPFHLNLEEAERRATVAVKRLKQKQRDQEERERRQIQRILTEEIGTRVKTDLKLVENKLRELRRKAIAAEEASDYERAISLYEQILQINPRDEHSALKIVQARDKRHVARMDQIRKATAENYDLALLGLEESSVVYQQIFRYPDLDDWVRLSRREITLEEEIRSAESPAEREIKRKFGQEVTVVFDGEVTFGEALATLGEIGGLNFIPNKDAAAVIDEPLTLSSYENLPLENVLSLVLRAVGVSQQTSYNYSIKEGAIIVGPQSSLAARTYLRFYDMSDLISSRPNFPAPPLALDEQAGKTEDGGLVDLGSDEGELGGDSLDAERLLELIQAELGGDGGGEDDEDVEDTESGISMLAGKLSARTTLENHLKLAALLDQLRKSTGVMVTVESRFLDVQDNFLEDIGISFGSPANSFLPNTIPDIDGVGTSVSPGWEYVNPQGDYNARASSISRLSTPLGSQVDPFNLSAEGGGVYQLNALKAERFQLEAILTGVAKEQEIRRLNSPRVTAFNGQNSHTLVVNQSAFIQDLEVNQTGVIPVINPVIGVLNSGSILEVRPTLSYDRKYVVLEIQPTLAEQLESDVAQLTLSGNFTSVPVELPVLSVTKIKTTITVPDGGTVLVGGLKREIYSKTKIGVPGLLDLPLLNLLLGRRGESILRSNLFVLINAKITVVHEEEARLFGT